MSVKCSSVSPPCGRATAAKDVRVDPLTEYLQQHEHLNKGFLSLCTAVMKPESVLWALGVNSEIRLHQGLSPIGQMWNHYKRETCFFFYFTVPPLYR